MTLTRLLVAAVLLCSLAALAQDHPKSTKLNIVLRVSPLSGKEFYFFCPAPAATSEQPWRIIPSRPAVGLEQSPLSQIRTDEYRLAERERQPDAHCFQYSPTIDQRSDIMFRDTICYAIRSYVVARDSKDSDSTHPVSYSTCQPAARYQLRTTEIRSGSTDR